MSDARVMRVLNVNKAMQPTLKSRVESRRPLVRTTRPKHVPRTRPCDASEASLANPTPIVLQLSCELLWLYVARRACRDEIARPNNTQVTPVLAAAQGFEL